MMFIIPILFFLNPILNAKKRVGNINLMITLYEQWKINK